MNQLASRAMHLNAPQETLMRARDGDRHAFGELVRMHQRSVFSLALRMLNNRSSAEDLAQDVFVELYGKLQAITSVDHLKFWLRKVVTHRAIDRVRRSSVVDWCELNEQHDVPSDSDDGDPIWQRQVGRMIGELSQDARAVVLLRYQEDLEPTDIASLLDMSINTVKSHLKRSLATLRRRLRADQSAITGPSEVGTYD